MKVAIIGSRGFIGHHMVAHLLAHSSLTLILVNRRSVPVAGAEGRVISRAASLLQPESLRPALADADIVVNLAWPAESGPAAWVLHLAEAIQAGTVRQLIHCSTAVVAGRTSERIVDEKTTPAPMTEYERNKLEAEQRLSEQLAGRVPLVIARPTVVFGPRGQNLVSLATALISRHPVRDFGRRALFGDRPMHLVPVATVVQALTFLLDRALPPVSVFQIAADDDPHNTYRGVEGKLRVGLGLRPVRHALVLPPSVLHTALRLRGRSDTNPHRRYSTAALRACGFGGGEPVGDAVENFGRWFAARASAS